MKHKLKILTIFPLAFFLAACSSFRTAGISVGLKNENLTYAQAKEAIEGGADVKNGWTGKAFIQQAAEQERWDLVELFAQNGASCFDAPGAYDEQPFSLFKFVIESNNLDSNTRFRLIDLCLKCAVSERAVAENQLGEYVKNLESTNQSQIDRLKFFEKTVLEKIEKSGFAEEEIFAWKEVEREREEKRLAELAERERLEREREAKEAAERAERERLEREREAKETAERAEQERLARIEAERLEKERQERETKEAAERAERERIERERQAKEAPKKRVEMEKQIVEIKLDSILENNQKLSDEERSRGNALLLAFANEHLPLFAEKYKAMRTKSLEAEANFNELLAALKADGLDPNKDETAQALSENLRNLRVSYWTIRYKINDFYSQFKIGVITPEELAKADEEIAPLY